MLVVGPDGFPETPQRWGILPTLTFWQRPHFWRAHHRLVTPLIFLATKATMLLVWSAPSWRAPGVIAGMAALLAVAFGLLERYIRSPARQVSEDERYQQLLHTAPENPAAQRRALMAMYALLALAVVGLCLLLLLPRR